MNKDVSCLMVAYNASKTIARALHSALDQVEKIILVDDGSIDNTASIAQAIAGDKLILVRFSENKGIGAARQAAVEVCDTEFACWLDSDDIWLSGRVSKLKESLLAGADYVFDESELYDSDSVTKLADLTFPYFLLEPEGLCYQIGRNYIPTIGSPMVKTSVMKDVGYNKNLRQAEDNDHFMRALLSNKVIKLVKGTSYREYCYSDSASRDLAKQNHFLALSYVGSSIDKYQSFLDSKKLDHVEKFKIVSMLLVRMRQWQKLLEKALSFKGGCVFSDKYSYWYVLFIIGVAYYQLGDFKGALNQFTEAHSLVSSPEILNNIGVCMQNLGEDASQLFKVAIALKPDYIDANNNLKKTDNFSLTFLPLRTHTHRGRYSEAT